MLVIASHINYNLARINIIESLQQNGYDMSKVIMVVAGAPKAYIETNPDTRSHWVFVTTNCFELSAVVGARNFARLLPKSVSHFLFIQDTSFVGPKFVELSKAFIERARDEGIDVYYASADRRCNIAVLSRRFLELHGHRYDFNANKSVAWAAEHDGPFAFSTLATTPEMPQLTVCNAEEEVVWEKKSAQYKDSEIMRCCVYFKALDLTKLVAINDTDINPPWDKRCTP